MRLACLVSAQRQNRLSFDRESQSRVGRKGKVRDRETRSPDTRDACATQTSAFTLICDFHGNRLVDGNRLVAANHW